MLLDVLLAPCTSSRSDHVGYGGVSFLRLLGSALGQGYDNANFFIQFANFDCYYNTNDETQYNCTFNCLADGALKRKYCSCLRILELLAILK